jgi:Tfp pilus assembly protein PilF
VAIWEDAIVKSRDGFRYGNNNNQIAEAYAEALSCQGYLAERGGKISAARDYYFKALGWDTTSKIALNNLAGIFLRQGKPLSGLPYLIRLTESYPRDDAGFTNLGLFYHLIGKSDLAEENFKKALDINQGYKRAKDLMQVTMEQRLKAESGTLNRTDLTLLINSFSQYIPDVK